jgi:hypothetical protein
VTTYFQFTPNVVAPFTFQPTLDGEQYTAVVTWNLFGQRWYITVSTITGDPVFTLPLIGSPDGVSIQSISWAFGTVKVVTARPHHYTIGQTVLITISGCAPDAYNGVVLASIVDAVTFTYKLASNPGDTTQLGSEIYNINIAAGYFTSTLVYRESSKTFEVNP